MTDTAGNRLSDSVFGVTILKGGSAEEISAVMRADYAYLRATYTEFLGGYTVQSMKDPCTFFHLTEWQDREGLERAQSDPQISKILAGLPEGVTLAPHVCQAVAM
jgi:hypothetical protein